MSSSTKVFMLCFLGMIMVEGVTQHQASVRRYRFEVINSSHTRLCTNKTMLTVNGQFPGPTVYARRGDLVIVDVINRADQNITIHWHGVKMPRYPWSDGVAYVTQCPIRPGASFRQRIVLSDEEGTLWWHAHSEWSRATVYGALIILPPKKESYPFPRPHAQVPILLGEWWNSDVQEVMKDSYAGGRDPQPSDAYLINGQPGHLYPCSAQDMFKLRVEFGKTYLVRMVNAEMSFIMVFKIAGHNLTVVGSDGAYTKPLTTDYVAIAPGQTIDFLLEADQPPSHYYMASRVYTSSDRGEYVTTPATAVIEYAGNYAPPSSPSFPDSVEPSGFDRLRSLATEKHPVDVPKNITRNLFVVLSINLSPCNLSTCEEEDRLLASMNNVSMRLPTTTTDILDAYYRGINGVFTADFPDFPPSAFDFTQGEYRINESRPRFGTAVSVLEYGAEVEVVFQGTNFGAGIYHPVHLHGYSFYVVGSGLGNFDPDKDPAGFNLVDPPFVESVIVPRKGWAAIRFKANNPGVWYMHCHFERHQSWGMRMAFIVKDGNAPDQKVLPPPLDMPRCGGQHDTASPHPGHAEPAQAQQPLDTPTSPSSENSTSTPTKPIKPSIIQKSPRPNRTRSKPSKYQDFVSH